MTGDESQSATTSPPAHLARAYGFVGLFGWALFGLGLEAAHAFKLAAFLDDRLTRLLLTLGHAHGVGLSLVLVVSASAGLDMLPTPTSRARVGRALRFGAVIIPTGFVLGAVHHPEGDPSLAVVLVPIGALALLYGLFVLARASLRRMDR